MTTEQLTARLARDRDARARELGYDNQAALETALAEAKTLREADEARRVEDLSEQDKLKLKLETAETEKLAMEEERDHATFQAHVGQIGARLGIKNLDYAEHLVAKAADALADGQQLDAEEYLTTLTAEGSEHRAALGLAAPTTTTPAPVTTTPGDPNAPPPAPAPPGAPPAENKGSFELDATAWAAKKAALGLV